MDSGVVRHLLPAVSDSRILIKASFAEPLGDAPTLQVDGTSVAGRMSDTRGEYWHFHATDLRPGRPHRLALVGRAAAPCVSRGSLRPFPDRTRAGTIPRAVLFLRRRP